MVSKIFKFLVSALAAFWLLGVLLAGLFFLVAWLSTDKPKPQTSHVKAKAKVKKAQRDPTVLRYSRHGVLEGTEEPTREAVPTPDGVPTEP